MFSLIKFLTSFSAASVTSSDDDDDDDDSDDSDDDDYDDGDDDSIKNSFDVEKTDSTFGFPLIWCRKRKYEELKFELSLQCDYGKLKTDSCRHRSGSSVGSCRR